jgi:hypothetical protein
MSCIWWDVREGRKRRKEAFVTVCKERDVAYEKTKSRKEEARGERLRKTSRRILDE